MNERVDLPRWIIGLIFALVLETIAALTILVVIVAVTVIAKLS